MIFGMKVHHHHAVCLVSPCSLLDLDPSPQSQDNRSEFRSQLPHLLIYKQCVLLPPN